MSKSGEQDRIDDVQDQLRRQRSARLGAHRSCRQQLRRRSRRRRRRSARRRRHGIPARSSTSSTRRGRTRRTCRRRAGTTPSHSRVSPADLDITGRIELPGAATRRRSRSTAGRSMLTDDRGGSRRDRVPARAARPRKPGGRFVDPERRRPRPRPASCGAKLNSSSSVSGLVNRPGAGPTWRSRVARAAIR